jgi:peptidase A4-like protein
MRQFTGLLPRSLAAIGLTFGLAVALAPAVGAAPAGQVRATPSEQAALIARTAIKRLAIGRQAIDQPAGRRSPAISGLTQVQSTNWSGYADTGTGFTQVSGDWAEPTVTCGPSTTLAAFWIGIDGYSSDSVEQAGTLIECYGGTAYQYTWWEMYPANAIQIVGETVASGDAIVALINRKGTSYTLKITDTTHPANSFSTTQSCTSCANTSAEWIAEAPSGSTGIEPLAHFGTWKLTAADVAAGGSVGVITTFPDDEITMVDSSGNVMAQPSALNGAGTSFTDTWKRSS